MRKVLVLHYVASAQLRQGEYVDESAHQEGRETRPCAARCGDVGACRKTGGNVMRNGTDEHINGPISFGMKIYETVVSRHTNQNVLTLFPSVISPELGRFY